MYLLALAQQMTANDSYSAVTYHLDGRNTFSPTRISLMKICSLTINGPSSSPSPPSPPRPCTVEIKGSPELNGPQNTRGKRADEPVQTQK